MNTFTMLLKREFWEHRSLWIAPLVWVGILVLLSAWVLFVLGRNESFGGSLDAQNVEEARNYDASSGHSLEGAKFRAELEGQDKAARSGFTFSFLVISALVSGFTTIVVFFYLIDCLFAERRDRSILFWKSLPISDSKVVLSKFTVAMLVMPLAVIVLTVVTQLTIGSLLWLRTSGTVAEPFLVDWTFGAWWYAFGIDLAVALAGLLWYAPIAAYFMLLSVWARKLVFLWAVIPLIAAPLLELLFFRTSFLGEFLDRRFTGYVYLMNIKPIRFDRNGPNAHEVFDTMSLKGVFTSPEMWLGLLAAAGLLYLTIIIRRHRDET